MSSKYSDGIQEVAPSLCRRAEFYSESKVVTQISNFPKANFSGLSDSQKKSSVFRILQHIFTEKSAEFGDVAPQLLSDLVRFEPYLATLVKAHGRRDSACGLTLDHARALFVYSFEFRASSVGTQKTCGSGGNGSNGTACAITSASSSSAPGAFDASLASLADKVLSRPDRRIALDCLDVAFEAGATLSRALFAPVGVVARTLILKELFEGGRVPSIRTEEERDAVAASIRAVTPDILHNPLRERVVNALSSGAILAAGCGGSGSSSADSNISTGASGPPAVSMDSLTAVNHRFHIEGLPETLSALVACMESPDSVRDVAYSCGVLPAHCNQLYASMNAAMRKWPDLFDCKRAHGHSSRWSDMSVSHIDGLGAAGLPRVNSNTIHTNGTHAVGCTHSGTLSPQPCLAGPTRSEAMIPLPLPALRGVDRHCVPPPPPLPSVARCSIAPEGLSPPPKNHSILARHISSISGPPTQSPSRQCFADHCSALSLDASTRMGVDNQLASSVLTTTTSAALLVAKLEGERNSLLHSMEIWAPLIYLVEEALKALHEHNQRRAARTEDESPLTHVYRGIRNVVFAEEGIYGSGGVFSWPGFSSCSSSRAVANDFATADSSPDGTLFVLQVNNPVSISRFSKFPEEEEILLPPNCYFRVETRTSREQELLARSVPIVSCTQLDLTKVDKALNAFPEARSFWVHRFQGEDTVSFDSFEETVLDALPRQTAAMWRELKASADLRQHYNWDYNSIQPSATAVSQYAVLVRVLCSLDSGPLCQHASSSIESRKTSSLNRPSPASIISMDGGLEKCPLGLSSVAFAENVVLRHTVTIYALQSLLYSAPAPLRLLHLVESIRRTRQLPSTSVPVPQIGSSMSQFQEWFDSIREYLSFSEQSDFLQRHSDLSCVLTGLLQNLHHTHLSHRPPAQCPLSVAQSHGLRYGTWVLIEAFGTRVGLHCDVEDLRRKLFTTSAGVTQHMSHRNSPSVPVWLEHVACSSLSFQQSFGEYLIPALPPRVTSPWNPLSSRADAPVTSQIATWILGIKLPLEGLPLHDLDSLSYQGSLHPQIGGALPAFVLSCLARPAPTFEEVCVAHVQGVSHLHIPLTMWPLECDDAAFFLGAPRSAKFGDCTSVLVLGFSMHWKETAAPSDRELTSVAAYVPLVFMKSYSRFKNMNSFGDEAILRDCWGRPLPEHEAASWHPLLWTLESDRPRILTGRSTMRSLLDREPLSPPLPCDCPKLLKAMSVRFKDIEYNYSSCWGASLEVIPDERLSITDLLPFAFISLTIPVFSGTLLYLSMVLVFSVPLFVTFVTIHNRIPSRSFASVFDTLWVPVVCVLWGLTTGLCASRASRKLRSALLQFRTRVHAAGALELRSALWEIAAWLVIAWVVLGVTINRNGIKHMQTEEAQQWYAAFALSAMLSVFFIAVMLPALFFYLVLSRSVWCYATSEGFYSPNGKQGSSEIEPRKSFGLAINKQLARVQYVNDFHRATHSLQVLMEYGSPVVILLLLVAFLRPFPSISPAILASANFPVLYIALVTLILFYRFYQRWFLRWSTLKSAMSGNALEPLMSQIAVDDTEWRNTQKSLKVVDVVATPRHFFASQSSPVFMFLLMLGVVLAPLLVSYDTSSIQCQFPTTTHVISALTRDTNSSQSWLDVSQLSDRGDVSCVLLTTYFSHRMVDLVYPEERLVSTIFQKAFRITDPGCMLQFDVAAVPAFAENGSLFGTQHFALLLESTALPSHRHNLQYCVMIALRP